MADTALLRSLYELQRIDARLAALERQVAAARETLAAARRLREAERRFREAAQALQQAERDLKAAEHRTAQLRAKLNQVETRLYDGSVRNPRELQALQAEAESLRRRLDEAEDDAVHLLLTYEHVEARYLDAVHTLERERHAWFEEAQRLEREIQAWEDEIAALREQRAWWAQRIPQALQDQYEHLRRTRGGLAVAEVRDGVCTACGAALNAALRQKVYRRELAFCDSCGRILYPVD